MKNEDKHEERLKVVAHVPSVSKNISNKVSLPNCSPLIKKQKVEVVSVCSCIIVSFGCHKGQHMVIEFTRLRRSFITFASHEK